MSRPPSLFVRIPEAPYSGTQNGLPGPFDPRTLARGRHPVEAVELRHHAPGPEDGAGSRPGRRLPRVVLGVSSSTGIVIAQLGLPAKDAYLLIQGHAFATHRSMLEIADDLLTGRLHFTRESDGITARERT